MISVWMSMQKRSGGPATSCSGAADRSATRTRASWPSWVGRPAPPHGRGQRRGAWLKMLERLGLGARVADDMGLGKTATVLALLQDERLNDTPDTGKRKGRTAERGPTLVICPTSVAGNWARESERFTPELSVMMHHGATRSREATF